MSGNIQGNTRIYFHDKKPFPRGEGFFLWNMNNFDRIDEEIGQPVSVQNITDGVRQFGTVGGGEVAERSAF